MNNGCLKKKMILKSDCVKLCYFPKTFSNNIVFLKIYSTRVIFQKKIRIITNNSNG